MKTSRRSIATALALLALAPTPARAAPAESPPGPGRHHLGVIVGYARHLDMVASTGYSFWGATARSADLRDALDAGIRYRFSLRPGIDLALETHRIQTGREETWISEGTNMQTLRRTHRTDTWGVGLRRTIGVTPLRPFLQVGFVHVRESERLQPSDWPPAASDFGVALATGGEVPVSPSFSIPIEVGWMSSKPKNDVSTVGVCTGITWHIGR